MPSRLHTTASRPGCVFMLSSAARSWMSPAGAVASSATVNWAVQCTHVQCMPASVGGSARWMAAGRHTFPPSRVSSTRVTLRPPPAYA
jgi:hypothetical protein